MHPYSQKGIHLHQNKRQVLKQARKHIKATNLLRHTVYRKSIFATLSQVESYILALLNRAEM